MQKSDNYYFFEGLPGRLDTFASRTHATLYRRTAIPLSSLDVRRGAGGLRTGEACRNRARRAPLRNDAILSPHGLQQQHT